MARDPAEQPTEMPEALFRRSEGYREVQKIARDAEAERARERADAAAERVAAMAGGSGSQAVALGMALAGSRWTRRGLAAAAAVGWIAVLAVALKWSGLI